MLRTPSCRRPAAIRAEPGRPVRSVLWAVLGGAAICVAPARASAHGGAGAPLSASVDTTPQAPPGDGATAQKILAELRARAQGGRAAQVVAEAVGGARLSLERAHAARAAGDAAHARMLDALALEWAETARDLLRAVAAEDDATAAGKKARELQVQVERARTLLQETQARHGRAAAELEQAEAEARERAQAAAESEEQRIGKKQRGAAKAGGGAEGGAANGDGARKAPKARAKKGAGGKASKRGAP